MSKVPTFDLDSFVAREVCVWPGCEDRAIVYVARCFDHKRMGHCGRHHYYILSSPNNYNTTSPAEDQIARWEDEGGMFRVRRDPEV